MRLSVAAQYSRTINSLDIVHANRAFNYLHLYWGSVDAGSNAIIVILVIIIYIRLSVGGALIWQ